MSKKFSTLVLLAGTFLARAVSAGTAVSTGGNTVATYGNGGYLPTTPANQTYASETAVHGISNVGLNISVAGRDANWNTTGAALPIEAAQASVAIFGRR